MVPVLARLNLFKSWHFLTVITCIKKGKKEEQNNTNRFNFNLWPVYLLKREYEIATASLICNSKIKSSCKI